MQKLLTLPAGRKSKWYVLTFWLVAVFAIMGTNLPGKYTDAEKNESSSFLPGEAESTKALEATERLQDGEQAPTLIVYRRADGLTGADKSRIVSDLGKLNRFDFRNTTDFGNPAGPAAGEPFQLSEDGTTALIGNTIEGDGEADTLLDPIEKYRETVSDPGGGLEVKVTGPAGVSADAIKVFENINGTLILAAGLLVFFLLVVIYRSPVFWFFPLFSVIVAEIVSRATGYGLTEGGVTVNGQTSSITSVLVLGAGTDYALLLVARYREELRLHQDKHEAMRLALQSAAPAIIASALTVAIALMALVLAKVNGTSGMGPVGAVSILVTLLVQLTLLPALVVAAGRRRFWPFIPYGPDGHEAPDQPGAPVSIPVLTPLGRALAFPFVMIGKVFRGISGVSGLRGRLVRVEDWAAHHQGERAETHGFWEKLGHRIAAAPRRTWVGTVVVLGIMCLGLLNYSNGLTQANAFRDDVESIAGQDLIAEAFPAGQGAPVDIVVRDQSKTADVVRAVGEVDEVADVVPTPSRDDDAALLAAFIRIDPYSTEAFDLIPAIREAAHSADPDALVGGATAVEADLREYGGDDTVLLIPITILIVFLILLVLLRALTISLLLIGTVVLSFGAALGVASLVFDVIFGFPGADPSFPLFAFIFLVALGVDYNIFLMARVREEALKHGTRDGMLRGLAVTGGVITSAGIVLAGTFTVLGVLPLTFLTEIGFAVAFGVLLDTFIVRSVLVPALVLDAGPKVWWPSRLAAEDHARVRSAV